MTARYCVHPSVIRGFMSSWTPSPGGGFRVFSGGGRQTLVFRGESRANRAVAARRLSLVDPSETSSSRHLDRTEAHTSSFSIDMKVQRARKSRGALREG